MSRKRKIWKPSDIGQRFDKELSMDFKHILMDVYGADHLDLKNSIIAGSSVANMFFELSKYEPVRDNSELLETMKQILVYQKDQEITGDLDLWYEQSYHKSNHRKVTYRGGAAYTIDNGYLYKNISRSYQIESVARTGLLNMIRYCLDDRSYYCDNKEFYDPRQEILVDAFDMNCCMAGFSPDGGFYVHPALDGFCQVPRVEYNTLTTPLQTFVRAMNKSEKLDVYFDAEYYKKMLVVLQALYRIKYPNGISFVRHNNDTRWTSRNTHLDKIPGGEVISVKCTNREWKIDSQNTRGLYTVIFPETEHPFQVLEEYGMYRKESQNMSALDRFVDRTCMKMLSHTYTTDSVRQLHFTHSTDWYYDRDTLIHLFPYYTERKSKSYCSAVKDSFVYVDDKPAITQFMEASRRAILQTIPYKELRWHPRKNVDYEWCINHKFLAKIKEHMSYLNDYIAGYLSKLFFGKVTTINRENAMKKLFRADSYIDCEPNQIRKFRNVVNKTLKAHNAEISHIVAGFSLSKQHRIVVGLNRLAKHHGDFVYSTVQMSDIHDLLNNIDSFERRCAKYIAEMANVVFPELPDSFLKYRRINIRQIKDKAELVAEGNKMHHCVGGSTNACKYNMMIFHVKTLREKGTLGVKIYANKLSYVQFSGVNNCAMSPKLVRQVKQWLKWLQTNHLENIKQLYKIPETSSAPVQREHEANPYDDIPF